ncbi:hypothetical protein [Actinacidiphila bryophytorum]|uniref:DUF1449 family protein n=2 Tax=Actinacidiphila bryophytorum TaxID=1436133 RepID=A0A9W4H130_9ACTN|nr:hypothetical protein [Actinacidiphila bryophytorum]MBM9439922.1 hypothetical protein [Actinacidiphila bryophytorum]CAG7640752.1 conserved membrane hypothetical protein [Actinacidiphila bryophytorum]
MGQFTDVVLGFPTVLFTGGLVAVVAFWAIVLVGGADAHGPWHHGAAGGHGGAGGNGGHSGHGVNGGRHDRLGGEADGHGGGAGALAAAGLGGVPVTVVLSLLVALSWFLSLAGSAALHGADLPGRTVRVLLGLVVTAAAPAGAWSGTWLLVRPLRRLFPDVRPPSREDFVGRVCVIRTGTVTARFGQAEVAAPDGSTAVVQVRQTGGDTFTSGSSALLYAYDPDGEFFWVAPFDTLEPLDTFTTT